MIFLQMKYRTCRIAACVLAAALLTACGGGGEAWDGSKAYASEALKSAPEAKQEGAIEPVFGCTVEVYGDSIMAGNGTAETPSMTLQRLRPGLQVVADHSAAGTMLAMLYPEFAASPRTARFVVIENGVIDAWRGASVQRILNTYGAMIERVRSEGRVPVLTGFSRQSIGGVLKAEDISRRDSYDAAVKNYATELDVAFADWGGVQFGGPSDLLDFVHPNKTYSDRLVEQLALTLDKVAPECVVQSVDGKR